MVRLGLPDRPLSRAASWARTAATPRIVAVMPKVMARMSLKETRLVNQQAIISFDEEANP